MQQINSEREKIEQLASEILIHKKRYYSGQPSITDAAYDALEDELRQMCPHHPVLSLVGYVLDRSSGTKVEHVPPMLSLEKTYNLDDLLGFVQENVVVCSEKFDGMALSLEYDSEGNLYRASTRGSGRLGENVTEHVFHMSSVPKRISVPPLNGFDGVEVRGEVYFPLSKFADFGDVFDSFRNAVPGTFGRKEVDEAACVLRVLGFVAYDVLVRSSLGGAQWDHLVPLIGWQPTFLDKLRYLEGLGFATGLQSGGAVEVPQFSTADSLSAFVDSHFNRVRDYQIDGLVFRISDEQAWERLGNTAHHPRGSLAFKRAGEVAETFILGIETNVGRSGKITFRARLEPVLLSGAKIGYATLHNAEFIESGGYAPGALVRLTRSGEVIPAIIGLAEASPESYVLPTHCLCGKDVIRRGPDLLCSLGSGCPFADRESLVHFVKELDVMGVSDKILERLRLAGLVSEPADLFGLTVDDLLLVEGFQRKSAENFVASVALRKKIPLATFLAALGLSRGGIVKCREVARRFATLERVRNVTVEDLTSMRGWAERSASEFLRSLQGKAQVIDKLLGYVEVLAEESVQEVVDHPLSGKAVCITGALARPRDEYRDQLEKVGARYVDSVSRRTDYLVCNETSSSSKYRKALELSVPVLTETQFTELLGSSTRE